MTERANIRDRVNPAEWETLCTFVRKMFHPYPCITAIGPLEDGAARVWSPYRGQPHDPSLFELVEAAWDHEHCDVCNARVEGGDAYWTNDGPEHVDLCALCYPLVAVELKAEHRHE
jgi:hypothetical protein